jgi:polysaccharide deacetylase 2 family uncharacterized protein YibQ
MDMNAPLGMTPRPRRRPLGRIAVAVGVAALVGGFGVYLFEADPHGGEPYAVAVLPAPRAPAHVKAETPPDITPTGSIGPERSVGHDSSRMENGVKVVSPVPTEPGAPRQGDPLIIDVTRALDGAARRNSVGGASETRTASKEDAPRPTAAPSPSLPPAKPKVAIFIGGMGLDSAATRTAIESMPAGVSLAFIPYGSALGTAVTAAKAKGHEILLQLPMQGAGGAPLGPHTLRADESPAEIGTDLAWLMTRVDGYAGVTNFLGASVTSNPRTMTAILNEVHRHARFYLDDGTSKRSMAQSLGTTLGMTTAEADVVLDATGDPNVVRANLNRLAVIARTKGVAIGMASGLPDHMPAIARFATNLDAQGLTLVPVSAIALGDRALATTR